MIKGSATGIRRSKDQKGMKRMKDTSQTSSSQSLMVTTPYMSLPASSNMTAYTAWALPVSVSPSTGRSCFPPSTSPSMKMRSFPTGSSTPSATTPPSQPWPTTHKPRRIGELQLSSNGTMTCIIRLPAWLQSRGAWPLLLKPSNDSWSRVSNASLAPMPMSGTSSSAPSTRAPTSTPNSNRSLLPSPTAHAVVQLDSNQRVMS